MPLTNEHTQYLSFLLHRQDFWVNFCSTQKCENATKWALHKLQQTAYNVNVSCGAMTSDSALQTSFCHVVQNYMKGFAPQTMSAGSATIIMYANECIENIYIVNIVNRYIVNIVKRTALIMIKNIARIANAVQCHN